MAELVRVTIESCGAEAEALVDERGSESWGELDERVNRLIHVLRDRGLREGDAVAVLSSNRREYFEVFTACAHAGLVSVPVNWHFVAEEVRYVLENAGARALVVDPLFGELAREAATDADSLELVALLAGPPDVAADATFESYEELLAAASPDEPTEQTRGGPMFYTSGTTGHPKGVRRLGEVGGPLAPGALQSRGFAMMMGAPDGGTSLLCGPVYHSAQWAFSYLLLLAGTKVVMLHGFDPAEVLRRIDRHRVTSVHLVPTQFVRLLRLPDEVRASFDGSSLQVVWHGAAPCPPEVKRRMIEWWGPVVTEYYGGTEGAIVTKISSEEWLERPTSVGRPVPVVEVRVLGEDGEPVAAGTPGQIFVRSLMAVDFEYHDDPAKTRAAHLEPGLFTMGDIGWIDDDGYLHLSDRRTDMIISGGVNIYPAEIERVLGTHAAVADAAVFGVPDDEFGESVLALVDLEAGAEPGPALADELVAHCRSHLAGYKVPRRIEFRELTRSATGKLPKRLLREPYWREKGRAI